MDFSKLTEAELKEALLLLEKQDGYSTQDECQESFLSYVNHMWPEFVCGRHHVIFAEKLEQVARGEINRLIVNMPPRHTKSEFASTFFPSWVMGLKPKMKIMETTHTGNSPLGSVVKFVT